MSKPQRIVNIAGAAGTSPTTGNLAASFANVTILNLTRAVQDAGNNHDEAGVEAGLSEIRETQARADELAEELGLADCSPTGITLE